MAHELTPWKAEDSTLTLKVADFSEREPHSSEINEKCGEGGALNANYATVDAVATIANHLGKANLQYGEHFVFKTGVLGEIILDFCDPSHRDFAKTVFSYDWGFISLT